MKNLLKAIFVLGLMLTASAINGSAQTIAMNAVGSSAMFNELGLAAAYPIGGTPAGLGATCIWTNNVSIKDTSTGATLTDSGQAFVAWVPNGGCTAVPTGNIYAYVNTDSVVGNRCMFNSQASPVGTNKCFADYTSAPSGDLFTTFPQTGFGTVTTVSLPAGLATLLTAAKVDTAGTDIRPEDAEFAIARALTPCNTPVVTGSQYRGLGYTVGSATTGVIKSNFSASVFNVINFTLPAAYTVTALGATPIMVVSNSPSATTGFNASTATHNIASSTLAKFLDGTFSYTDETTGTVSTSGSAATVILREPLSGTYNTMEYNAPNTTVNKTSQDVGVNQLAAQVNCSGTAPLSNPMNIATLSGGHRQRAIGTGQELSEVVLDAGSPTTNNTLGYAFWSTGNFAPFTAAAAPNAKYYLVDGLDPLYDSSHTWTGLIPTATADVQLITLNNMKTGNYPIWSLLRLVTATSTVPANITAIANASQHFVPAGVTNSRPDYVPAANFTGVRSHFIPPIGAGEPVASPSAPFTIPADGQGNLGASSHCTATEIGGDVGGVVTTAALDSVFCTSHPTMKGGNTGLRR